jgi:hypothetical protein
MMNNFQMSSLSLKKRNSFLIFYIEIYFIDMTHENIDVLLIGYQKLNTIIIIYSNFLIKPTKTKQYSCS